jgi:TRAP transporter 4TM/12TM fusion protein
MTDATRAGRPAEGLPGAVVTPIELDAEAKRRVEALIEEDEGAANRVSGWLGTTLTAIACATSLFHLYAAYDVVPADVLRIVHVGLVLFLSFLMFPAAKSLRDRVYLWDWIPAILSLAVMGYVVWQGSEFGDRATLPLQRDVLVGAVLIVLLLEATRRTTGWIMPAVAIAFLLYAALGNRLPAPWTHRGYDLDRIVAHLYMTLEGIFGTTVDVSATLIILFTIYGAILQASGAGKFFIDFSFAAMGGKRNSAGRAVVLSSFLLGGPSGSGVATTVTIGTVAYPLLEKAGYGKNAAGGLLAAGGLGAIISPPVLGAAAFLIAEFLKISYFDVILMATIPTILYYLAILVMVEVDARKYHGSGDAMLAGASLWQLTSRYWYHFTSLVSIILFMLIGFSPTLSVFWATVLAIAASTIRSDTAIVPRLAIWPLLAALTILVIELFRIKLPFGAETSSALVFLTLAGLLVQGLLLPKADAVSAKFVSAMREGTVGVLNVATTCATAGIIVGVVTLTGLAQRFADIIIGYAEGSLLLTTLFTAAIVWIVGLAVPVTASYIMCAVIAAPALIKLGVPDYAAHMFIFYYAVLSEVSPPTALSPFAAAAITGGDPYKTTLQSWKYTMPAFLVPFVFVLDPAGIGLLMKIPKGGSWVDIVEVTLVTAIGIAAFAFALQGWVRRKSTALETGLFALSGVMLVLPQILQPMTRLLGVDVLAPLSLIPSLGLHVALGLALLLAGLALQSTGSRPQEARS